MDRCAHRGHTRDIGLPVMARLRRTGSGNALATLVGDNFCARQRLHAEHWPGGEAEVRDGVLLVRLPGAEQMQTAFATGFATDPIATAVAWYGDDPFALWLPATADVEGATVAEEVIGLSADLVATTIVGPPTPQLKIEIVDRAEIRDDYVRVVLGFAIPDDVLRNLFPLGLFTAPGARGFVGYLGPDPVTCCWTLRTGDVVGLYGVFTAKGHRRRGLLRELLVRATAEARTTGAKHAVTQTATAERAFDQLGFREATRYTIVTSPTDSTRHPSQS
jgi:GNAT superfamily N-acetyltransferase